MGKHNALNKTVLIIFFAVIAAFFMFVSYKLYYEAFYPIKYSTEVESAANKYNLDSSLIYSVINTESGFDEHAVSKKGAVGLMQLMPSTALWISERLELEDFSFDKLYEPNINIDMGAYYLRYLLDKFEDTDTALAAYNAGEGTVRNWLNDSEYSLDKVTLNRIPYAETEKYVKKVSKSRRVYKVHYKKGFIETLPPAI